MPENLFSIYAHLLLFEGSLFIHKEGHVGGRHYDGTLLKLAKQDMNHEGLLLVPLWSSNASCQGAS